jgi:spore germination protein YaaH
VNCININEIPNITNVNTLVVDIEGGELKFLQENQTLLENQISKIIIEIHENMMYKSFAQDCAKLIKDYGFKLKDRIGNTYIYYNN